MVLRAQGLEMPPNLATIAAALPATSPAMGNDRLERVPGATIELVHDDAYELESHAVEFAYAGTFNMRAEVLADGNLLDEIFSAAGGWISSALIGLSEGE